MLRYALVLSALSGMVLLAAPQVRAQGFPHDFKFCLGDFALCAASTCTPTGGTITVNTATGTAPFPAAQCICPIFNGPAIGDLNGGNMQGSCDPPPNNGIWSMYALHGHIPQAINDWSRSTRQSAAPAQVCPADLDLGSQSANCFSFACVRAGKIRGVDVAVCTCPLGESLEGTPIQPNTAFVTQAGQCDEGICSQHPVSGPLPFDNIPNVCFPIPEKVSLGPARIRR